MCRLFVCPPIRSLTQMGFGNCFVVTLLSSTLRDLHVHQISHRVTLDLHSVVMTLDQFLHSPSCLGDRRNFRKELCWISFIIFLGPHGDIFCQFSSDLFYLHLYISFTNSIKPRESHSHPTAQTLVLEFIFYQYKIREGELSCIVHV